MVPKASRCPREMRRGHFSTDGEQIGRCFGKLTHIQPDPKLLPECRQDRTQFVNLFRG
jgi:hypothetical protein